MIAAGVQQTVEAALTSLPPWLAVTAVLVASLLAARVVQVGGDWLVRRVTRRIDGEYDDIVLTAVHPALYVTVVVVGLYLATVPLDLFPAFDYVQATALSVLTVLWAVTLVRVGGRLSDAVTAGEQVEQTVVPIFQNVWSAVVLGTAVFLLLFYWNVDVTPFLASAGIVGIAVGFAARDTIANLFGSIALYFDGTYKVGDYVVLESGERGRVEDISIRSTVLRTRDDVLVTVPNAVLNSARITNESVPSRERRIRVPIGVAYGSDLDHVEATLLSVAAAERLVLDTPRPRVRVREFGDSAVALELLCWIADPVLRGRSIHNLNKAIYRAFAAGGIEIPFPRRVVTLGGADAAAAGAAEPVPGDDD
ncbi:MAG: mechanosensitive ion channel family protein [Haloarculaceae archaeon]